MSSATSNMRIPNSAEAPSRTTRADLIVVDDNPKNLKLLERMLADCGYRVRLFPRGSLALSAAASNPPDLFLLDINMPEMNGYEVCRHLKSSPDLAGIPVIFLSALDDTADKVKAFAVGGIDYVTKPFQLEEVRARIDTHLELRRKTLQLQDSYAQLQKLESLRDNLTHMIVHDMRTPLTIINGVLELIEQLDAAQLSEKGLARVGKARRGVNSLIEMVNSLLDISKLESGAMEIEPVEFDLAQTLHETLASFADTPTGLKIELDVPESGVSVEGDKGLLARVIQNLVGNALKYSPNGSTVAVALESTPETVQVSISDQGEGIAVEHREKIFDKFYQVEHRKNSTGLGLAYCKLVVEAHEGRIGVESEVGAGSTFSFIIPRKQARK